MEKVELRPILNSAIKKQVIEYNQDIGDEGLIDTISSILTNSRLSSINFESDGCLRGDVLEPTDDLIANPPICTGRKLTDGDWKYHETLERSWELRREE